MEVDLANCGFVGGIDAGEVAGHGSGAAEGKASKSIKQTTTNDINISLAAELSQDIIYLDGG